MIVENNVKRVGRYLLRVWMALLGKKIDVVDAGCTANQLKDIKKNGVGVIAERLTNEEIREKSKHYAKHT